MKKLLSGIGLLMVLACGAMAQNRSALKPAPQTFAADVFRLVSDLQAANAPAAPLANAQALYDRSRAAGLAGSLSPTMQFYVRAFSARQDDETARLLAQMTPFDQGLAAYVRHDYGLAQKLWLPVADGGDAEAAANLGMLYASADHGATGNDAQALAWYRRAALLGQEVAQENLATLYSEARGTAKDAMRAYAWRTLAAEQLVKSGFAASATALVKKRDAEAPDTEAVNKALAMAARCRSSQYRDCD